MLLAVFSSFIAFFLFIIHWLWLLLWSGVNATFRILSSRFIILHTNNIQLTITNRFLIDLNNSNSNNNNQNNLNKMLRPFHHRNWKCASNCELYSDRYSFYRLINCNASRVKPYTFLHKIANDGEDLSKRK